MTLAARVASPVLHNPPRLENRGPEVIRCAIASIAMALILFCCRIGAQFIKRHKLLLSDYLLFSGLIFHVANCIIGIYAATKNLGRHMEVVLRNDPTLLSVEQDKKYLIVVECLYGVAMVCIKLSILDFYRTLFPIQSIKIATNIIGAFVITWFFALIIPAIFGCTPVEGAWKIHMQPPPKCVHRITFMVGSALPNTLTDVAILVLPVRQVWKLHLDRRSKVALTITFLLGGFVCIASIIRIKVVFDLKEDDLLWTLASVANWSSLELAFAVASACLPTLRPLFTVIIPKPIRRKFSKSNSSGSRDTDKIPAPIMLQRFTVTDKSIAVQGTGQGIED